MNNGTDEIFLWNRETGESMGRLEDERRPRRRCYYRPGSSHCGDGPPVVFCMAISPDDRFLVVGSKRPDVEIWDLETRRLIGHLEGHCDWVTKVAYSPYGQWIATTELDSTKVNLWDAETRQLVRTWHNGDAAVGRRAGEAFELLFGRDSRRLYVVTRTSYFTHANSSNDRVRVWDIETTTLVIVIANKNYTCVY